MAGYVTDIERATLQNDNFRKVLFTGPNSQLVVMSLQPGEDIGLETHHLDQFIRIEQGQARAVLGGEEHEVTDDYAIVIPAGTPHNIINISASDKLKLYTVYSPPEHPLDTVHVTKAEADAAEHAEHLVK